MRLKAILSDEPRAVLEALENCNIRTDEEFLCSATSLPNIYRRLPAGSISYAHLERLRERVLDSMAAPGCTGLELLERTQERMRWKETLRGLPVMDDVLRSDEVGVVEVSGGKGSMKTVNSLILDNNCCDFNF